MTFKLTPSKLLASIFLMPVPKVRVSNAVQLLKISIDIFTDFGMTMLVRPVQPLKAPSSISVTESGMTVFLHPAIKVLLSVSMMALQLSRESYFSLLYDTTMLVRPVQPEKSEPPITVTDLPMTSSRDPLLIHS